MDPGCGSSLRLPDPTLFHPGVKQDGRLSTQNGRQMGKRRLRPRPGRARAEFAGREPSERADLFLGPLSSTSVAMTTLTICLGPVQLKGAVVERELLTEVNSNTDYEKKWICCFFFGNLAITTRIERGMTSQGL